MTDLTHTRRFGVHQLKNGTLQRSTLRYQKFHSELAHLLGYLHSRLLPTEPEEADMQGVLSTLQNLLEQESESLISHYVCGQGNQQDRGFLNRINTGYVSFKSKCDWMLARSLIDQSDWNVMDEVRALRNAFAHAQASGKRKRYKYRGFALLTQQSVRRLFVDVELVLRKLRAGSGQKSTWSTIPPGYPKEMGWAGELVDALTK
jgi:hypothetical protein